MPRESKSRLQTIIDTVPSGIIVVEGPEERITYMNRRVQEFFVVPPEIGMPIPAYAEKNKMMHPDGRPYLTSELPMSRALHEGKAVYNDELVIETPTGERNYLLLSAAPLKDSKGRIYGAVTSTENITPLVKAREALRQAYERERYVSQTLQQAFLPNVPDTIGYLRIVSLYKAASKEAAVGGDFYDVFEPNKNMVALVVGDVSGKGVDAAVHTALAKYSIRAYAHQDPSPCSVVGNLNNAVFRQAGKEAFITLFYGVIDQNAQTLTFTVAGHEPPLLINENVTELTDGNTALGIIADIEYPECTVPFSSGSLLLYTDGVVEARGDRGFFGRKRLKEFAFANRRKKASDFVSALVKRLEMWTNGNLTDDIALLLVQAEETSPKGTSRKRKSGIEGT